MKYTAGGVFALILFTMSSAAQGSQDAILGKWMSVENNLLVEIYKYGTDFQAKVLWFDDSDDKSHPYNTRLDSNNPDHALRQRRIVGMQVLHGLIYSPKENKWEDGRIYDSKSGKTWDAAAWISTDHILKVRGFWHFEFLGETIRFKKYQSFSGTKG